MREWVINITRCVRTETGEQSLGRVGLLRRDLLGLVGLGVGLLGDLGGLLLDLVNDLVGLLLGALLGSEDVLVDLVDDGLDLVDDVGTELVRLLLDGALLGKDDRLDVGRDLGEALEELVRELLALLAESVQLLEERMRNLGRLLDGGGVARVKLRVDGDSLVDDVLDDGLRLADEGGDALCAWSVKFQWFCATGRHSANEHVTTHETFVCALRCPILARLCVTHSVVDRLGLLNANQILSRGLERVCGVISALFLAFLFASHAAVAMRATSVQVVYSQGKVA